MADSRTIRLTLAYDGTAYQGWQRQPDRPSVQATVEQAVRDITCEDSPVSASGRTDAGVHALAQVAHFHTESQLDMASLCRALNARLPADIAVREAEEADPDFHSRYRARRKTYFYQLWLDSRRSPLHDRFFLHHRTLLDVESMRTAASILEGKHDFRSFVTGASGRDDTTRTVHRIRVMTRGRVMRIFVSADGFLQHMVRALSGALVRVGTGQDNPAHVRETLLAASRSRGPVALPPQGLFLWRVDY